MKFFVHLLDEYGSLALQFFIHALWLSIM